MSGHVALFDLNDDRLLKKPGFETAASNGFSSDREGRTVWETPNRLTVSFAPDGTSISKYQSSLFEAFEYLLDDEALQKSIRDSLQDWARESNVNFGLVGDSGDVFGIGGPTQGDARFGDVRFGAIPLSGEVFAIAVPHDEMLSGTWAGDVLFNSNAKFDSVETFVAVTMHEVGHVLGLEHSTDPKSVMHPGRLNVELSGDDIKQLQIRYGARSMDQYDFDGDRNDSFDDATDIKHTGSMDGRVPLFVYGDIENATDQDYFVLDPLSNYQDAITFRLVTDGISFLGPKLEIFDEERRLLGTVIGSNDNGDDISFTIKNADDNTSYFARITTAAGPHNNFGSYAMLTTFDANVAADPVLIESTLGKDYAWLDQRDVHQVFTDPNFAFNNDLHTNDTFLTADELRSVPGAIESAHYRVQASLFDSLDVDFYTFESAYFDSGFGMLTAKINALETNGLISKVEVFDRNFDSLDSTVVVNGNGEFVLQVDGVESESTYYAKVVADSPGENFDIGNYTLDVSFDRMPHASDHFGSGVLSGYKPTRVHTMYVAETQLFHFALTGSASEQLQDTTIWMTVYDEDGSVVHRIATRPSETRTAKSIVLQPGSYSMRVNLALPSTPGISFLSSVEYRVDGKGTSDPIGPEIIIPGNLPFPRCDPRTDVYCYPRGRHTSDPFIVVNGNEFSLPPGTVNNPPWYDINAWYWFNDWLIDDVPPGS